MTPNDKISDKKKIGLIVNPFAGIGGRVGLKGSDGPDIVKKAFALGAVAEAPGKAAKALERIRQFHDRITIVTCPGDMGETAVRGLGFDVMLTGEPVQGCTLPRDTEEAAARMLKEPVELLMFAGGDGTARNIYNIVGNGLPVIGIPAGVKIHSAVYADTPAHAGDAAVIFLSGLAGNSRIRLKEAEVMDIDEQAYRNDRLSASLYGYMLVPDIRNLMQSAKAGSSVTESEALKSIASDIVINMEKDVCYIIGPGTTTKAVMDTLNLKNTLLGVDAVLNGKLIKSDINEKDLLLLLEWLKERHMKAKIVVTVIGGQGYVFGRGNQQISNRVIDIIGKENIIIAATESKMIALNGGPLLVDTGDDRVNKMLSGYVKVITGLNRKMVYRLSC